MTRLLLVLPALFCVSACQSLNQGVSSIASGVRSGTSTATLAVHGLPWQEAKLYSDWAENRGQGPWTWSGDTLLALVGHKPDLQHRQQLIQEAVRRGLLSNKDLPVVQSRTIGVGVSKRAVTGAWGRAAYVHQADGGPGGWQEYWEYKGERGGVAYVYFDRNGNVARWQQTR